ncbi:cellulase family glycosylhydrolase [Kitasatospora cathayae]|uniref:Endoglucanase n=1 Tax=Kitasatospora cathayae TaxID=3004092 RepID=A0ABY7PWG0_9ACTN|nr:cellulase family glycosylhydrolase [Kitasatospora sp. HUAS 3-15]WBP84706.1 cellulase family glycosylhydrolase [Kitasatospora sp. HUAS 3-15]
MPRTVPPRTLSPRTAALAAATAGCAALAALPLTGPSATAATGLSCNVSYAVGNDWGSGFTTNVTITDTGTTPINGWTLGYTYPGNQTLQNGWNGNWTQSGQTVTVTNPSYAPTINPGATYTTSANFSYTGTNTAPTAFTVNGTPCGPQSSPSPSPTPPTTPPPTTPPPSGAAPAVHVAGSTLATADGTPITLHGVNRSGAEFMCVQGHGIFDGPADQTSVTAMKSWRINAVRVPLNEDCWLAHSNVDPAYAGATYISAVRSYVDLLHRNGLVAILDLHWTDGAYTGPSAGCSDANATCQKPMPDAAGALPFWTSVAQTFKGDDATVFDLFNEPYPSRATGSEAGGWACWRDGGSCPGIGFRVAGMQAMVDAVRSTGADNVLLLGGQEYANDLTQWAAYLPADPLHNLAASWHSYNFNTCANAACWDAQIGPLAARVPVVTGELGESDCAHGYLDTLLPWLDQHGVSYLAWAWNTWDCGSGPALISSYDGTPTAFGAGYRAHLADG